MLYRPPGWEPEPPPLDWWRLFWLTVTILFLTMAVFIQGFSMLAPL